MCLCNFIKRKSLESSNGRRCPSSTICVSLVKISSQASRLSVCNIFNAIKVTCRESPFACKGERSWVERAAIVTTVPLTGGFKRMIKILAAYCIKYNFKSVSVRMFLYIFLNRFFFIINSYVGS